MAESFVTRIANNLSVSAPTFAPKRTGELTASAKVSNIGDKERQGLQAYTTAGGARQWQRKVWNYYDEVGELHYALSFLGACLSRCNLTIGHMDERGIVSPAFDENGQPLKDEKDVIRPELAKAPEALDIIRSLKSDVGGQAQLLRAMGQNLSAVGEFNLVGSLAEGDNRPVQSIPITELKWEVLSTDEFYRQGDGYERRDGEGSQPKQIKDEDVHVIRIWKSHPRFSSQPDSPIRAVLDILEELVLLTRQVRGEALSRLSNAGLLLVPSEIEWPTDDNSDDEDEDGFTRDLITTFGTAISDKGSAAGNVPFVIRAPKDFLTPESFRLIDLTPNNADDSVAKRKEAVQRFAQGIDMPVEVVTGHAGTTFANAVVIDDSLFKSHIEPLLEVICDALSVGLLHPALEEDNSELWVTFDSSELVARPNRSQDAKDLHDRDAISDAALRASAGFGESDAPSEEELEARIGRKSRVTPGRSSDIPGSPNDDPEGTGDGPGGDEPGGPIEQGEAIIRAAMEVAVERSVQRAGARIRSKAQKSVTVRDQLAQVPNGEVALTLGPSLLERIVPNEDLFKGEFDMLESLVTRWTGDREYATRVKTASNEIAKDRLWSPREQFPKERVPTFEGKVNV